MHVGLLGWRPAVLASNFPAVEQAFLESKKLICCQSRDLEKIKRLRPDSPQLVFSEENADEIFGAQMQQRKTSIGHTRNLLQLASSALALKEGLCLLDDDVAPGQTCGKKFARAFSNYDFVQGSYTGSVGNGIYMLVYFFDLLSDWRDTNEFRRNAEEMLHGAVQRPAGNNQLRGTTGGLMGVSPKIKSSLAFFPTRYPFDDHFFEFSARWLFRSLRFMGEKTQPDEIPIAEHRTVPSTENKLVDHYILYAKSAIVENYAYFKLSGCVPSITDGSHKLVKAESFDAENMCRAICRQAALEKFRTASSHYLSQGFPGPIRTQLERMEKITEKDIFVSQEELESEWAAFEEERAWLSVAKKMASGKNIPDKLFGR